MEQTIELQRADVLEHVPVIGIQAAPPKRNFLHKVGLGRFTRFNHGSFTQMALNEMYEDYFADGFPVENIRCYETHAEVIHALGKGAVEMAVIPVDNTVSGRVKTAIKALTTTPATPVRYQILEEKTIAIHQYLLHHRAHSEKDIEQVTSQKPALDQAHVEIEQNGWGVIEAKDTVMSAIRIAKKKGIIGGKKTAAIASRLAGEANGLTVGRILSKPGNATTFWRITANESMEIPEDPNRIAFSFTVPDRPGSLHDMISPISALGCNFTDIDCHLSDDETDEASFFAEIAIPEGADHDVLIQNILESTIRKTEPGKYLNVMGVYKDTTKEGISDIVQFNPEEMQVPDAINISEWSRRGRSYNEALQIVYVYKNDAVHLLEEITGSFKDSDINLLDMTRPTRPDSNGARGFFFHIDADADPSEAIERLEAAGYSVKTYQYKTGELALAA